MIKCKNYKICGETELPSWWFECKGNYLCTNCDVLFGKILEITDNIECVICLENKLGLTYLNCEHTLCIECFKRCYYGDESREGEPVFPYPEIENEYFDDDMNPKWNIEYPLIKQYNDEWNAWDDERDQKRLNEQYLLKCGVCRR